MRKLLFAFSAFALISIACASTLRSQIQKQNDGICKAVMARDINAYKAVMKGRVTSNFRYIEDGRPMTYQQMLSNVKVGFSQVTKMNKATSRIISLKEKGDVAVCLNSQMLAGLERGAKGNTHKMTYAGTSRETYRKVGGKWLLTEMVWKTKSMTMDGKTTKM